MADNGVDGRQSSMMEHEMEMQRQIMSVSPVVPSGGPMTVPPPILTPQGLQTVVIPHGVPPPPTPPSHLPPPQSQNWSSSPEQLENDGDDSKLTPLMSVKVDNPDDDGKNDKPSEVILPKALEDVLALKDQRAAQFEGDVLDFITEDDKQQTHVTSGVISTEYADADGESDEENDLQQPISSQMSRAQGKLDKNKRKKKRKKQNRKNRQSIQRDDDKQISVEEEKVEKDDKENDIADVTVEYVPERITIADLAPMYRQFYRVFEIFKLESKPKQSESDKGGISNDSNAQQKKPDEKNMDDDDDDPEEEKKDDKEKLSKRKLKKLTRLSVAELKQLVNRPDVVEMHDVTARDPKLLVQLKAHRNTVQVPRHWCFKRKYLQGKRGIEKPPFDLPAFIKKTGIMEMRESLQEKDEAKSLKAKMRERTRPKMGKIDIDYQKLHDAFFKWQTKPRMTIHGDLYYEGKEFETRLKEKKPGDLSEELRISLGMPVGPNCHKIPPPWLIAQQRYGPPPSYPNLKIPGLNAPIPEGTSFGYHAGGWGKPPVDENGKPLYGDVFGTNIIDLDNGVDEGDIERNTWGELESESEESSEEEEEEGEDLGNAPDESGLVTPAEGLVTPSGLTSVPAGMETPDNIELRKKKIEAEMEDNETPVLYQVLPEKRTDRVGASMMGSTHVYDISTVNKAAAAAAHRTQPPIADREGMVELALDPSELDMDNDAMAQRYEQQMREQQSHLQKEDLSDMLAEHVARQKSKRKRQQADTSKQNKKYKEFKF